MDKSFQIHWERILGVKEVAEILSLSVNTIRQYSSNGSFIEPDCYRSGNPLWSKERVLDWKNKKGGQRGSN
tara:strand:- start:376 stop:588 length:213 start_codon:yes stop_codon:yes gene_type:complete